MKIISVLILLALTGCQPATPPAASASAEKGVILQGQAEALQKAKGVEAQVNAAAQEKRETIDEAAK